MHYLIEQLTSLLILPSVVPSLSRPGLCQEVFNILPGTVNPKRGAAQYGSEDQAFSFHKQVQFEDNDTSPKLRPDVKSGGGRSTQTLPVIPPRYQIFLQLHMH